MVPNDRDASIGMEYFCFEGDELWTMADDELVKFATREIQQLGLATRREGQVRLRRARAQGLSDLRRRVRRARGRRSAAGLRGIRNLIQVGRNGLHRYNNSDHSMLTAMRAVDNILLGTHHDIWAVNAESVYHEEDVSRRAAISRRARDAGDGAGTRFGALRLWPDGRFSRGSLPGR